MENQCCCGRKPREPWKIKRDEWLSLILLNIFKLAGFQKGIALHYEYLGDLYLNEFTYSNFKKFKMYNSKAEKMYSKALEINLKLNDKERTARNYFYLGLNYHAIKNLDKAEEAYLKAIEIYKEIEVTRFLKLTYNLGFIYKEKGQLDKAEEMFLKLTEGDKKKLKLQALLELSEIYEAKNDKEKEKEYLQKAVDILKEHGLNEQADIIQKKIEKLSN